MNECMHHINHFSKLIRYKKYMPTICLQFKANVAIADIYWWDQQSLSSMKFFSLSDHSKKQTASIKTFTGNLVNKLPKAHFLLQNC